MTAKKKSDPFKPSAPIHRQASHKKGSVKAIDSKENKPLSRSKSKTLAVEYAAKEKKYVSGFPVVGIGASAGGLKALELFFSHMPGSMPRVLLKQCVSPL